MKIAIIGLGLIGGSLCKALKSSGGHQLLGFDTNAATLAKALSQGAIDGIIAPQGLAAADISFICLHPEATILFAVENAKNFRKDSIVCDVCGVKSSIVEALDQLLHDEGVIYLGTHPMAGREFSGFDYAVATLFKGASFIMTPTSLTPLSAQNTIKALAEQMGFDKIVITTAEQHDQNIAFTSQLAHLVSNAYVKSPSLRNEQGFSAGSFQDLTRVAKLNENLWTSLFMMNRTHLLKELTILQAHLKDYQSALEHEDTEMLHELLARGRRLKEGKDMD